MARNAFEVLGYRLLEWVQRAECGFQEGGPPVRIQLRREFSGSKWLSRIALPKKRYANTGFIAPPGAFHSHVEL
jgi:hypothetical protein